MPTAITSPIGIILAGGNSTRMGRDKAGLCLNGETLLCKARNTLLAAGCSDVILSGHSRPDWKWREIPDITRGAGPASGIASSVIWAHNNGLNNATLVYVPVDTPLLTPKLIAKIIGVAADGNSCSIEGSPLPAAISITSEAIKLANRVHSEFTDGIPWSVRKYLEALGSSILGLPNAMRRELSNINTPQEWEELSRESTNRP